MKFAGKILALVLTTSLSSIAQTNPPAQTEATKSAPAKETTAPEGEKLSPTVAQELSDKLPKYAGPAPEAPPPATAEAASKPNPEVLQLEKVKVTPKKRPRLNDSVMLTTSAFNEKLAKEKMSSFDRDFLNKYPWLGGFSAAERAREEYNRAQHTQVVADTANLARAVEINDPEQAKALRDAAAKP